MCRQAVRYMGQRVRSCILLLLIESDLRRHLFQKNKEARCQAMCDLRCIKEHIMDSALEFVVVSRSKTIASHSVKRDLHTHTKSHLEITQEIDAPRSRQGECQVRAAHNTHAQAHKHIHMNTHIHTACTHKKSNVITNTKTRNETPDNPLTISLL